MTMGRQGPAGLWDGCSEMEKAAMRVLSAQLAPFETPLRNCYEAGVQAPTLPGKRHKAEDMRLAALFLKRTLTDLRGVWLFTHLGYTSQAASVAAVLCEHALAVNYLAGSVNNAKELLRNKTGDLPWSVAQLSKALSRQHNLEVERGQKKPRHKSDWREIYSAYKFLCKMKHPTLRSTMHDAFSATVKGVEFVVMAAPDVREEDLPLKATILAISISRCYQAVRQFAIALKCDSHSEYYKSFIDRMSSIIPDTINAYKLLTANKSLPFTIGDSDL